MKKILRAVVLSIESTSLCHLSKTKDRRFAAEMSALCGGDVRP
jgi:hypothetical protein